MENTKEQLEEVIKKNLPEKKEVKRGKYCNDCGEQIGYGRSTKMYYCPSCPFLYSDKTNQKSKDISAFNQALSQINTSLIADEVLKVVAETYREAINFAIDEINMDATYLIRDGAREGILKLIDYKLNLSPNKENE